MIPFLVYQRRNEFRAKSISHYFMYFGEGVKESDLPSLSKEEFKKFWHFYYLLENNKGLPAWMRPDDGYPLVGDMEGYQHAIFYKEETNKANGVKICEAVYRIDGDTATIIAANSHFGGGRDVLRLAKQRVGAVRVDNKKIKKQKQREQEKGEREERQRKGQGQNKVQGSFDDIEFCGSEGLDGFLADIMRERD